MNLHIKLLGGNVTGTLESAEQIGDGRVRLTVNTPRFGRFTIALDAEEAKKAAHPTPAPKGKEARV